MSIFKIATLIVSITGVVGPFAYFCTDYKSFILGGVGGLLAQIVASIILERFL